MNKTININLDGQAFTIEEEAYKRLSEYLDTIKSRLGNTEVAGEVLMDIEARIAELFRYKCEGQTVTLQVVEEIIDTIGEPAEIVDEEDVEEESDSQNSESAYSFVGRKTLYRDPDDRVLGGVCAGLGAYFDVDPLVFRIIAVVTTFMFVIPPIIYIILWIAMPKAITLEHRLAMRGGINFKKMGDNIKKEYDSVSEKFKNSKHKANFSNMQHRVNKTGDAMAKGLRQVLNIFGILLGICIVIWSVLALMGLVGFFAFKDTILGLAVSDGHHFIASLPDRFLPHMDQVLASSAILLLVGIPFLVILYLGLKLIFQFNSNGKAIGMTALILWLAGIGLFFFTAIHVAKSYEEVGTVSESHPLTTESETIYLRVAEDSRSEARDYLLDIDHLELFSADGNLIVEGAPIINILRGNTFKISVDKKARGYNEEDAEFNAEHTLYNWAQEDSILYLDKQFIIGEEALVRHQKVYVNIQVPYDTKLEVSPYLDRFIDEY